MARYCEQLKLALTANVSNLYFHNRPHQVSGGNLRLAMAIIDTHAHLYNEKFKPDWDQVLYRLEEAGVAHIYLPNVDHTSIDDMLELELRNPNLCSAMMGLHPCYVQKGFEKELYVVEEWLKRREWVAIGEIGTDLYWDKTTLPYQEEAFKIQCQWALDYKLPVAIHCRESVAETLALVKPFAEAGLRGVFHCWSGTLDQAQHAVEFGFYLGIGGTVTYKNTDLPQQLAKLPKESIVLETDCPYLAPIPMRGKRNEPAYLSYISQKVADSWQMSKSEAETLTTDNAKRLFAKQK